MRYLLLLILFIPLLKGTQAQQPLFHPVEWEYAEHLAPQIIVEDRQGFIWIANQEQVFRYDGYQFDEYAAPDSFSSPITALSQGTENTMIVGTASGQIWKTSRNGSPEFIDTLTQTSIRKLIVTADSTLWIATYGDGLFRISAQGDVTHLNQAGGLNDDYVYDMVLTPDHVLWIGTDAGVNRIVSDSETADISSYTIEDGLPDNIIKSISRSANGDMFFGAYEGGVSRLDAQSGELSVLSATTDLSGVTTINAGSSSLWVGTKKQGLWEVDFLSQKTIQIPQAANADVTSVFIDREENLWVSSKRSGLKKAFSPVRLVEIPGIDQTISIRSLVEASEGTICYSTDEGVFMMSVGASETPLKIFDPSQHGLPPIISMYAAGPDDIWLGSFGGGIIRLHPPSGRWEVFTEASGLTNGNILSITGKGNTIWVGTLGGVSQLTIDASDKMSIEKYTREDGISDNYIYQVEVDDSGNLWIATDGNGVTRMRGMEFDVFLENKGLVNEVIYSVTTDHLGITWALSQEGNIFRIDGEYARLVPSAFRSNRSNATGIVSTNDDALLIIHQSGIDRYDPATGLLISYGTQIGATDLSPDLNAICEDHHGNIWIGSRHGLIRYTPLDSLTRTFPQLVFDQASLFFTPTTDLLASPLASDQNHLTFQFLGLWFQNPEAVRYRHRLEGYDLDWLKSQDRQVSYPRLTSGDYQFQVAAGLGDQYPSSFTQEFRIEPPVYLRWWFWALILLGISILLILIVRTREKRLRRDSNREKENIRYQFDLLRNQVNPHFLFNSFNTLISLIEQDQPGAVHYVEKLSDLFRNMLAYREETLITLREELSLLENYVYLQQQRYRSNLSIELNIGESFMETFIPPLTLQLLVENAIKHNVISTKKPLRIQVFDQGNHIHVSNPFQPKRQAPPSTGLGLENIQKRYSLLSSQTVETIQNGETFVVRIPLLTS